MNARAARLMAEAGPGRRAAPGPGRAVNARAARLMAEAVLAAALRRALAAL